MKISKWVTVGLSIFVANIGILIASGLVMKWGLNRWQTMIISVLYMVAGLFIMVAIELATDTYPIKKKAKEHTIWDQ